MHEILMTNWNIACNLYWLILNIDEMQIERDEHHQAI